MEDIKLGNVLVSDKTEREREREGCGLIAPSLNLPSHVINQPIIQGEREKVAKWPKMPRMPTNEGDGERGARRPSWTLWTSRSLRDELDDAFAEFIGLGGRAGELVGHWERPLWATWGVPPERGAGDVELAGLRLCGRRGGLAGPRLRGRRGGLPALGFVGDVEGAAWTWSWSTPALRDELRSSSALAEEQGDACSGGRRGGSPALGRRAGSRRGRRPRWSADVGLRVRRLWQTGWGRPSWATWRLAGPRLRWSSEDSFGAGEGFRGRAEELVGTSSAAAGEPELGGHCGARRPSADRGACLLREAGKLGTGGPAPSDAPHTPALVHLCKATGV